MVKICPEVLIIDAAGVHYLVLKSSYGFNAECAAVLLFLTSSSRNCHMPYVEFI